MSATGSSRSRDENDSGPDRAPDAASIARFLRARGGAPGRRLAEAVRVRERASDAPLRVTVSAPPTGSPTPDDIERLVRWRAAAHPFAASLRRADERLRRGSAAIVIAALAVMAILGAIAAAAALDGGAAGRPVSVVFAIMSLLGLQTALLLLWIVLASLRSVPEVLTPLAALAHAVGRRLVRIGLARAGDAPASDLVAAGEAAAIEWRVPGVARWSLGALAHAAWSAFNVGVLLGLLLLLSVRAHTFSCETTILSDAAMRTVVRATGGLPGLVGLPVPGDGVIDRSLRRGRGEDSAPTQAEDPAQPPESSGEVHGTDASSQSDDDRRAFAGLLLGTVFVHGLVPRLLLTGWCLRRRRRRLAAWRLDLDRAGFARLRPLLVPEAAAGSIHEEPGLPAPASRPHPGAASDGAGAAGPPVGIAIELAGHAEDAEGARGGGCGSGWPPAVPGFVDLGAADDAAARRGILDALARLDAAGASERPRRVLAACSLTTTPDRGVGRFLERLRAEVGDRLVLVLTDGGVLRARADAAAVAERGRLWRELADAAGLAGQRVHEIDLGRLTAVTRTALDAAAGCDGERTSASASAAGDLPLDLAFALVADAAADWPSTPELADRVALHRRIVEVFGAEATGIVGDEGPRGRVRRLIGEVAGDGLPSVDRLGSASAAFVDRLPAALRAQPAWLAAGAATGALACLAAAAMVSPVALAALPGWSGVGAAMGSLVSAARASSASSSSSAAPPAAGGDDDASRGGASSERVAAIRAAMLFCCVLHLQGRPEDEIARRLTDALEPASAIDDAAPDTVRGVLAAVRARLFAEAP